MLFRSLPLKERLIEVGRHYLHKYEERECKNHISIGPVSYTHLDVYKRQVLIYFALVSNPVAHLSVGRKAITELQVQVLSQGSVSYTHLVFTWMPSVLLTFT